MTADIPPQETAAIIVAAAANFDSAGHPAGTPLKHPELTAWRTYRVLQGSTRAGGIQVLAGGATSPAGEDVDLEWPKGTQPGPATYAAFHQAVLKLLEPGSPLPRRVFLVLAGHSAERRFYFDDRPAVVHPDIRLLTDAGVDVIVILDACSSAEIQGAPSSPVTAVNAPVERQGQQAPTSSVQLGFLPVHLSESGAVEVAAMSATAEDEKYGALLSYFALSGLRGAADLDTDGRLTAQELSDYINAFQPSVSAFDPRVTDWQVRVSAPGGAANFPIPMLPSGSAFHPPADSVCGEGPVRVVLTVDGHPLHDLFDFGGLAGGRTFAGPQGRLAEVRQGDRWQIRCFPYQVGWGGGNPYLMPRAGERFEGTGPIPLGSETGWGSPMGAAAPEIPASTPMGDAPETTGVVLLPPAQRYAFERTRRARLDLGVSGVWGPIADTNGWMGAWPFAELGGGLHLAWSEGIGPPVRPNRSAARFALRLSAAPTSGPTDAAWVGSLDAGLSRVLGDDAALAWGLQGSVGYGVAFYRAGEERAWTGGPGLHVGAWAQLRTPAEGRRGPRIALSWAPAAWFYEVDLPPDETGTPGSTFPLEPALGRLEVDLDWSFAPVL